MKHVHSFCYSQCKKLLSSASLRRRKCIKCWGYQNNWSLLNFLVLEVEEDNVVVDSQFQNQQTCITSRKCKRPKSKRKSPPVVTNRLSEPFSFVPLTTKSCRNRLCKRLEWQRGFTYSCLHCVWTVIIPLQNLWIDGGYTSTESVDGRWLYFYRICD